MVKYFPIDSSKKSEIIKNIPLGGRRYKITMRWLERSNRWWIWIHTEQGGLVLSHSFVTNWDILQRLTGTNKPQGSLVLLDLDSNGECGLRDFGVRCVLMYDDGEG